VKLPSRSSVYNVTLSVLTALPLGVGMSAADVSYWVQVPVVGVAVGVASLLWERVTG
jgi:hypothetical protein